jgi:hypothetical protein
LQQTNFHALVSSSTDPSRRSCRLARCKRLS